MSGSSNQSTRTSPGSFGTTQRTESVSSSSSPPQHPLSSSSSQAPATTQHAMSTDVYNPSVSQAPTSLAPAFTYPFSPLGTSSSFDSGMRLGESPTQCRIAVIWCAAISAHASDAPNSGCPRISRFLRPASTRTHSSGHARARTAPGGSCSSMQYQSSGDNFTLDLFQVCALQ